MAHITIHGIPAYSFGSNVFSEGLIAVTFHPNDVSVDQIKDMGGVFLDPFTPPNSSEIFALVGGKYEFDEYYRLTLFRTACKKATDLYEYVPGIMDFDAWDEVYKIRQEVIDYFVPWYDK